jgi:hypothetical protein
MSKKMVEALSDRERACLEHFRQAQELKVTFSQYCRERNLSVHQCYWIRRSLVRKGAMAGESKVAKGRRGGFVPVRIGPAAAAEMACRIRHPSGWVIECGSVPQPQWLSALMSGSST